jgi:TamB, inner membrane protein subunit of TAM complex
MRALALSVASAVVLVTALCVFAQSAPGRAYLAAQLSALLDRELRGSLRIGRIVELTPWRVSVSDLEARAPDGARVAYVATATATLDPRALLAGAVVLHTLDVRGARVTLRESQGQLALVDCFRSAQPTAPSAQPSSFRFEARRVSLSGGEVDDLPLGFRLRELDGRLSLSYASAFRMRAEHVSGRALSAQGQVELALRQVLLSFVSGESSQLHARLHTGADALEIDASAELSADGLPAARTRLRGRVGPSSLALAGQQELAGALREAVELELEASLDPGPARVVASGWLGASAGRLALRADCTRQVCRLGAQSERLALSRLIARDDIEELGFELELALSGASLREYELDVRSARYGALVLPAFVAGGSWSEDELRVRRLEVPRFVPEPRALEVDLRASRDGSLAGKLSLSLPRFAAEPGWGRYAGLRAAPLRVQASGTYRAAQGELDVSVALAAASIEDAAGSVQELRLEGDAHGSWRAPRVALRAFADGIQAESLRVESSELELRGGPTRYELVVRARSGASSGEATFALALRKAGARLSGKARVTGLLPTPLSLTLAETTLGPDELRLTGLEASAGNAHLALSGLMRFSRASDLLLRARGICAEQLSQLGVALPASLAELRGCVTGQLHATGTVADPGLSAQAQVAELHFGELALGRAQATLELARGSRQTTLGLTLAGPAIDVVAQLEGELSEHGQQGLTLARGYQGRLRARADLERLAPALALDPESVRGFALNVELGADDQALRAELDLDHAGSVLLHGSARGRAAPLAVGQVAHTLEDLTADLELHQLPLHLFTREPLLATGRLDGAVRLRDLLTPAGKADLRLTLAGLAVEETKLPPLTIVARADGGGMHLSVSATQRGRLELEADVPWRWEGRGRVVLNEAGVRARARLSDVPLALLLAPAPNIMEVRGSVGGAVSLTGMHEQLGLEGSLALKQGAFTVREPFMRFERVELGLGLERNVLKLRVVELADQTGTLTGEGELRLSGLKPTRASLKLSARELPLRDEGIVLGAVSGQLEAEAQLAERPLRAQVRLRELSVQLPEHMGGVQELEPHAEVVYVDRKAPAQVKKTAAPRETEPMPFELELDASEPFWVRRPNLAVELSAKLRLRRDASGTRLRGLVKIERGLLTLLGRGFDLQRGSLNFEGGREIDPAISLDAVHKLGDGHTVTASVRGTLSAPTLNFTSSVPGVKTNAEALQLLVSGRDSTAGETAQAQVGAALAGLTAGMFGKITGGKYGKYIPVLSLEAGASAGTRMRAGVQADELIPKPLKGVVKGAYVEGFVGSKNQGGSRTGAGGVLMELYFPHRLVTGGTWELPNNWALEVTWEP